MALTAMTVVGEAETVESGFERQVIQSKPLVRGWPALQAVLAIPHADTTATTATDTTPEGGAAASAFCCAAFDERLQHEYINGHFARETEQEKAWAAVPRSLFVPRKRSPLGGAAEAALSGPNSSVSSAGSAWSAVSELAAGSPARQRRPFGSAESLYSLDSDSSSGVSTQSHPRHQPRRRRRRRRSSSVSAAIRWVFGKRGPAITVEDVSCSGTSAAQRLPELAEGLEAGSSSSNPFAVSRDRIGLLARAFETLSRAEIRAALASHGDCDDELLDDLASRHQDNLVHAELLNHL